MGSGNSTGRCCARVCANSTRNRRGRSENTPVVQEVIVTGLRHPGAPPNITATGPLTVVSRDEIQQQGHTDVIDFMNQFPQHFINSHVDLGNNSNPWGRRDFGPPRHVSTHAQRTTATST